VFCTQNENSGPKRAVAIASACCYTPARRSKDYNDDNDADESEDDYSMMAATAQALQAAAAFSDGPSQNVTGQPVDAAASQPTANAAAGEQQPTDSSTPKQPQLLRRLLSVVQRHH